jgi:hypothetical protein
MSIYKYDFEKIDTNKLPKDLFDALYDESLSASENFFRTYMDVNACVIKEKKRKSKSSEESEDDGTPKASQRALIVGEERSIYKIISYGRNEPAEMRLVKKNGM